MQARKTIFFEGTTPWIKKSGDEDFDMPMSCFDGAEICELVGTYIQSKLTNLMNKEDVGLYRDYGEDLKQKGKRKLSLKCLKNVDYQLQLIQT